MENYAVHKKNILAQPLDIVLKYLQDCEIQYTIKATEPVSRKFTLSEKFYCLNVIFSSDRFCELIVARKQVGLDISSLKGGVNNGLQNF
ncbi:MAG: hypothetical protein WCV63_03120 [Negativicutes bacterium]